MKNSIVFVIDGKQSKNRIRNLEAKICSYLGQSPTPWYIYITKTEEHALNLTQSFVELPPKTVIVSASDDLTNKVNQVLRNTCIAVQSLPLTKNTLILQKLAL